MTVVFRSGDMRRQMDFQTRATTQDAVGGQSTSWTTAFTAWVSIEPLSGRELLAAKAVRSEVTHRVCVRYRSALADTKVVSAMRGIYNGRIFNFHASMNQEERNAFIEIMASEGLNNG